MSTNIRHFLITGEPGVGKTTMTKKIATILSGKGIKTIGFYTEEVRNQTLKKRDGFDVVSLVDGMRGRLAREQTTLSPPSPHAVGKYGVLVSEFEAIALASLSKGDPESLLVIDEIGKMEFFSEAFKSKLKDIFSPSSRNIVCATIPSRKVHPMIENIRRNQHSKVWTVTRENRDQLHEEILREIILSKNNNE